MFATLYYIASMMLCLVYIYICYYLLGGDNLVKDVQCYELFGGIALKNHAFSFFFYSSSNCFSLLLRFFASK